MATASWESSPAVEQQTSPEKISNPSTQALERLLREDPWSFRFFQMVRLLERLHPECSPVGMFVTPEDEVVRFRAHTSLSFPASEIQSYQPSEHGPDQMSVNFMGLSTMNGPLPQPYSELLLERVRAKDHALGEFFDIFNHRVISLFYRGWKKYRFYIAYEMSRGADDLITRFVYHLLGLGTGGLRGRLDIADEAAIYYAGLLAQGQRTAQGLKQILADYFDVPAEIGQFTGSWNRLSPSDQTVLNGNNGVSECLGIGTVVGDEVWDQQGTLTVRLGPMPLKQYLEFLPGARAHRELAAWLRFYAREEFDFVVQLVLARDEVPPVQLANDQQTMPRLGFASWLKNKPFERDPDEAMYRLQ